MVKIAASFLRSESGSLLPVFIVAMVPIALAVGFSVDYTSAVATRGNMQNALDAAILSITTMPPSAALADRQTTLQQAFEANSGQGTAKLDSLVVAADGTATFKASASYPMPTNFMQIARINSVQVGVSSAVRKKPALVQTTFKIDKASGWWNKMIMLYGTQFGQTTPEKLMQISYTYNGAGDPKGYGTTTVYTVIGTRLTQVQQQVCKTNPVKNFNNAPAGAILQTGSNGKKYQTTCATTPSNRSGAVIDVSQMDSLYLEMDVPSGSPRVLSRTTRPRRTGCSLVQPRPQPSKSLRAKPSTSLPLCLAARPARRLGRMAAPRYRNLLPTPTSSTPSPASAPSTSGLRKPC